MKALSGWVAVLLLGGCWTSHSLLGETDDELEDAATEDGVPPDADAAREDSDSSPEDGTDHRDADAADTYCWDNDGDGHPSVDCGGDDCDDDDPLVYPGAPDVCGDGLDTNCDGLDPVGDGLLGPKVLLVDTPSASGNMYTALLWTGREYLFVWRRIGFENIWMVRLDTGGKQLGEEVPMREFQYAFDTAWSGSRLGAAWGAGGGESTYIYFQAFDATGRALTDSVRISDEGAAATDGSVHYGPRIVAAGEDFFVVWSEMSRDGVEPHGVWLTRVGPDGTRRFAPVLVAPYSGGDGAGLELAWTGAEVAVLRGEPLESEYPREHPYATGLRLQRMGWSGEPVAPMQVISDTASYSTQFQFLWTGVEFAAIWDEGEDVRSPVVTFARLDATGAEIVRSSLEPPLTGWFPEQRPVVWAERYFGVLWAEHPDSGWQLTLRRFEPSGALHGSEIAIPTSSWPGRLDIAWTGSEYGFIWSEEVEGMPAIKVYFQRATFCE